MGEGSKIVTGKYLAMYLGRSINACAHISAAGRGRPAPGYAFSCVHVPIHVRKSARIESDTHPYHHVNARTRGGDRQFAQLMQPGAVR